MCRRITSGARGGLDSLSGLPLLLRYGSAALPARLSARLARLRWAARQAQQNPAGRYCVSVIIEVLWNNPDVRNGLTLAVVASVMCGAVQAARGRSVMAPALLVLFIGAAGAVSLFQLGFDGAANAGLARCWSTFSLERWIPNTYLTAQGLANVCLYVPVGLFAWLTRRRLTFAFGVPVALTIGVELLQAYGGAHDCSPEDVLANVTGALVGVAVGMLASTIRASARQGSGDRPHASRRTKTGPTPDEPTGRTATTSTTGRDSR